MGQDYWTKRMKKYGHTGWASPTIYAFDNPIRIKIVDYLLNRILQLKQKKCLLDFGCGTGEFSKAQQKNFERIVIYDKCSSVLKIAKKGLKKAVSYSSFEMLQQEKDESFDVILSITVLQHVIDPKEMESVLSLLYGKLKKGRYLLVLESFGEIDVSNSYEKSWSYSDFIKMMEKSGFKLYDAYNYYKENVYSEERYQKFSQKSDVILLGRIYNHAPTLIKKIILKLMQWISIRDGNLNDIGGYLYPISDLGVSKFIIFQK